MALMLYLNMNIMANIDGRAPNNVFLQHVSRSTAAILQLVLLTLTKNSFLYGHVSGYWDRTGKDANNISSLGRYPDGVMPSTY